eukprot:jgi/Botrbrau1/21448/Bobra.0216s0056.1
MFRRFPEASTVFPVYARSISGPITANSTSWVNDMIMYARNQLASGQHDGPLKVLLSGIQNLDTLHHKDAAYDRARLNLQISEIEADRSNWGGSATAAEAAARDVEVASSGEGVQGPTIIQALLAAGRYSVRSQLASGQDDDAALRSCHSVGESLRRFERGSRDVHLASQLANSELRSLADMTRLVGGLGAVTIPDVEVPEAQPPTEELGAQIQNVASEADGGNPCLYYQQLASLCYLKEQVKAANHFFSMAAVAARPPSREHGEGGEGLLSPAVAGEVRASALMGLASLNMNYHREWDVAERILSEAVIASEGVSGDNHPRVAMPLVMLGTLFARTGRLQLAEGMYRGAARKIQLLETAGEATALPVGVHLSVAAVLCWQYAQLLAVFPNRQHEMTTWAAKGSSLFKLYTGGCGTLEDVLGSMDALRPQESRGTGYLMDVFLRRAVYVQKQG